MNFPTLPGVFTASLTPLDSNLEPDLEALIDHLPSKIASGELAITKYVNLAKKHNILPSTFANAYVNNKPFVTSNIIGATLKKHLEENFKSVDITLTEEMQQDIEDIHVSDPNPCV